MGQPLIQRLRTPSSQSLLSPTWRKAAKIRQPIQRALLRSEQTSQYELLKALEALQLENRELKTQLRMDHLTGAFNRRALVESLEHELQRFFRSGSIASLLLIDLNGFKRINDTHGHNTGDSMLKCATDYFSSQLRAIDIFARLGGDEFAILLRDTDATEAQHVIDKLCANAPQFSCTDATEQSIKLEFAIGKATLSEKIDSAELWLELADNAMYRHKRSTRLHLL